LPCSAITGCNGAAWPGGRAIAQCVATPPRAAETNEPSTYVGAAVGGGSSGRGGASGAPALVIDTCGPATDALGVCNAEPNAYAPAAPAAAPTPRRRIARRLSSDMRAIMPSAVGRAAADFPE